MERNMTKYYTSPARVMYRTINGSRTTRGGYGLIKRMHDEGRLIAAWSTSTGKSLASNGTPLDIAGRIGNEHTT